MKTHIKANLCKIMNLGIRGNLFGGDMLKWLDEAGAILAVEETGGYVVTIKFSEVVFKVPVKERDIVHIHGEVVTIGNTSLTVDLEATVKDVIVCSAEVVFVHVDSDGFKKPIDEKHRQNIIDKYGLMK